jgi:hypothetical protein
MTRKALLAACAILACLGPRGGIADTPSPEELAGREAAMRAFAARKALPAVERPGAFVRSRVRAALEAADRSPWDDYYSHRVNHFSGELAIDTATGNVTGTVRTDIVIAGDGHATLYFLTFLPVTAVTDVDGNPVEFEETYDSGYKLTHLTAPGPLADQDQKSYVFTVSGTPDCSVNSPFSINICHFNDVIAYLAMDMFLPGSLNGDFSTLDLMLTIPAGQVVASSGLTVGVVPGPDAEHETHHVVQDFRSDAHSLGIAPYQVAALPWLDKWIRTFSLNDAMVQSLVGDTLTDLASILEFYGTLFGDFLFPKMEVCQVTNDAGAAFGWPALLWIPDMMWMFGAGGGGGDGEQRTALLAHEMGHQWFPDMIKSNDWRAAWLSEGFAEFSSVSYMASLLGDDYAAGVYDQYGLMYMFYVPRSADYGLTSKESQNVTDAGVYQIVTYYKGATVANTIRSVIGQEKWTTALLKLYADIGGKDAYYDTKTLQGYLEAAAGQDLDWLFDEWVYGKGFPIYTFDVIRVGSDSGADRVRLRVRRAANFDGIAFTMPVTFRVVTDKGETDHTEMVDSDDMTFEYELDGRLIKVRFDPQRTFIKRVTSGLAGDADFSGEVDGIDLLYLAWAHGAVLGNSWSYLPWVDFDANAMIDEKDYAAVVENLGNTSDAEVAP